MTWSDQPAREPAAPFDAAATPSSWAEASSFTPPAQPVGWSTPPAPPAAQRSATSGLRRNIATAVLAAGLLVVGGAAVAFAADPAGSPAPSATTPSGGGSTQPAAPNGGTQQPGTAPHGGTGHNCPNMGGSGSGSGGSSAPSTTGPSSSGTPST
jgi:hypothetical protein